MLDVTSKIILGFTAFCFTTISIQLIPLSKKASIWNRCFRKTSESLSQVNAVKNIDDQSREVFSVMICNGAVFEPKINKNMN